MSHLHIPDGLLPWWLTLGGWILSLFLGWLSLRGACALGSHRALARLGFVAALMLVAMNIEWLAYHLNLSVVAGIILGPSIGFLASLLVDFLLALMGHGGITVVGLNALILGSEMLLGWGLYYALSRLRVSPAPAAFIATLMGLVLGTTLMLFIVWLSSTSPVAFIGGGHSLRLESFAAFVYSVGSLGWFFEAFVTAGVVRYLARVRPGLLQEGLWNS